MKIIIRLVLFTLLFFTVQTQAQTSIKSSKTTAMEEEEELPMMFKFEPNYLAEKSLKREMLLEKIMALDTLTISEKKRLRLIKALYKDLSSEKFEKAILVNTRFKGEQVTTKN